MKQPTSARVAVMALTLLVVVCVPLGPAPCWAQEEAESPQQEPADTAPPEAEATEGDPCGPRQPFNTSWYDWLQRKVYRTTCGSATWFDGFFGDDRIEEESEGTYGKVSAFAQWSEAEDWDLDARFRVKFAFPHMDQRIEALAARWQEEEYVSDTTETTDPLPVAFRDTGELDWLLGMGYSPIRSRRQGLRFSAGIDIDTPVDPFAKAEYRHHWVFPSDWLARFRQTLFWRDEEGVGATSRFDVDQRLGTRFMLRNSVRGTISDSTDGLGWYAGVSLYQDLTNGRAMAYKTWIRGATDAPVTVEDYGVRVRYRQRFLRDWLFAEASTGMTWVRPGRLDDREGSWGLGIGLEMLYGYRE